MRYIWAFILIFSAINPAKADCWAISNNDAQKMCLAKSKNDTTYCWQIKDNDEQKYCLAIIKREKSYCWQIKGKDKQQECLSMF